MTKNIVVTGAGSGIGRTIVSDLAASGHAVILLGRNMGTLEETRKSLEQPDRHRSLVCDVTKSDQIRAALTESGVSSLYGLVANAGKGNHNQYGESDEWQDIIECNLTGTYNTVHECLPYIRKSTVPYRKIIVMSSALAHHGVPGFTAYCAAKAGLLGMMRSFAVELAPEKILINAICPALTDTQMAHSIFENMGLAMGTSREAAYEATMSQVPLGKMSEPEEIARLTNFLMSTAETSITGQAININNGLIMV
ncbi:MAG: SDR family NAD(P)-dependent oxidoreductase [Halioglobus sp.]